MHYYHVRKHITPRKKNPLHAVINFFIVLLAIPVVVIALLSLILYFVFMWLLTSLKKNPPDQKTDEHYRHQIELLKNEHVHIILEEDELDTELSRLNDLWMENVYNKETCLYRARTFPRIDQLEGQIMCFYLKEKPAGVILQVINKVNAGQNPIYTQLVFLLYENLELEFIDDVGDYYLYNDEKNPAIIMGFNKREKIRMEIAPG